MKMEERLANMSVNHKAKLCNRMMRKVYTGTQNLEDLPLSTLVSEHENNKGTRCFTYKMFSEFGIGDIRKAFVTLPWGKLFINPVELEKEIDSSIKYYVAKLAS